MHTHLGPHEIAKLLGVSRQRVSQLMARPDFPPPADVLAQGKIWHSEDIEKWNKARKATGSR